MKRSLMFMTMACFAFGALEAQAADKKDDKMIADKKMPAKTETTKKMPHHKMTHHHHHKMVKHHHKMKPKNDMDDDLF